MSMSDMVTVEVTEGSLRLALRCLEASANDPQEPERYRAWYREARDEFAAVIGQQA